MALIPCRYGVFMNSIFLRVGLSLAAAGTYAAIIASIPIRRRIILKRAGTTVFTVQKKNPLHSLLILVCCALLIGLLWVKELGIPTDIIVLLVAVLGAAMGAAELSLNGCAGVYTKSLIGSGHFLPLSEIYALPMLEKLKREGEAFHHLEMKVITNRRGKVAFHYSSAEECRAVLEHLVKLSPSLAV